MTDSQSPSEEPPFRSHPSRGRIAGMLVVMFLLVFAMAAVAPRGMDPLSALVVAGGCTLALAGNVLVWSRRRIRRDRQGPPPPSSPRASS